MAIGVLDLGISNLGSLCQAIYRQGWDIVLVKSKGDFDKINHLIIPGVGSFGLAMSRLRDANLIEPIKKFSDDSKPILGICLGMQLLAEEGCEGGLNIGLNLISGKVKPFEIRPSLVVPHVGWNEVHQGEKHPVLMGVKNNTDFYFVHSYYFHAENEVDIRGWTTYGDKFASIVAKKNIIGVQFHPEKSQINGLRIIDNFCNWNGRC